MIEPYAWRCVCGDSGTGEKAAQAHAKTCHRFGMPNTNPYVEKEGQRAGA